MRALSRSIRATAAAGLILSFVLLTAGPAGAHVSVAGEVRAGGNGSFTFTVPNERDNAGTTRLVVSIPEDVPLGSLRVQPKPGWTVETTKRTLDEPIEVFDREVTEVVDTITWTADGPGIGVDQFDTFTVRGGPFPEDATEVAFPAVQTYANGEEVAWIEEVVEGEEEPERPMPVLELLPAEVEGEEAPAAAEAETAAAPTEDDDGGDSSSTLGALGLVVGLVALAVGGLALVTARRSAPPS